MRGSSVPNSCLAIRALAFILIFLAKAQSSIQYQPSKVDSGASLQRHDNLENDIVAAH
jgi:hypothetical protein